MTRIATFAYQQLTLGQSLKTQKTMLDLQVQVSTGKKSQEYAGLAVDSFRLVTLKSTQAQVAQHSANIQQTTGRLQTMDSTIKQVYDVASRFRQTLLSAMNGGFTGSVDTATEGANSLSEVAGLLNIQYEGRYLFSGSRTSTPPVDATGLPLPPNPITTPQDYAPDYYRGDAAMAAVEADTGFTLDYGLGADEPAFEYVIRAMHYVQKAGVPADAEVLSVALALINTAMGTGPADASLGVAPINKDLADLRAYTGVVQQTLDNTLSRLTDVSVYLDQNIGDIENVDITDAVSRMTVQQTQLEASYMTLSRLSQLTLVNYLN
jgi:flagellar hook-associated protein 3 FlgL